jgi:hypothetical protein
VRSGLLGREVNSPLNEWLVSGILGIRGGAFRVWSLGFGYKPVFINLFASIAQVAVTLFLLTCFTALCQARLVESFFFEETKREQ